MKHVRCDGVKHVRCDGTGMCILGSVNNTQH